MSTPFHSPPAPLGPGILDAHLAGCPSLRTHLLRLCDRCDRRGELGGIIKLGDASLPQDVRRALGALFGSCLKTSARGEHRLDLTRFLASVPNGQAWIDELYRSLGRHRRSLPTEKSRSRLAWRQILEQFRLAHPGLQPIHQLLAEQGECRSATLEPEQARELRGEWFALADAVSLLEQSPRPVGLSDLGARCFGDSKTLRTGRLRTVLCQWLAALDGDGEAQDASDILARYGVVDNPTSVKVTFFGRLRYRRGDHWLGWPCQLHGNGETATLSLDNLADMAEAEFIGGETVITCENETPFNHLVRENYPSPVVYTAGFPNAAVRGLLARLPNQTRILHWGDSDRAGYQIARILSRVRPLSLWRCQVADLEQHRQRLRPLPPGEEAAIAQLLKDQPDHPFAPELRFTARHGWLEQENW